MTDKPNRLLYFVGSLKSYCDFAWDLFSQQSYREICSDFEWPLSEKVQRHFSEHNFVL